MRRTRGIVNEMEFRMLREAKSFSPSPHAGTMKGFSRVAVVDSDPSGTPVHHSCAALLREHAVFSRTAIR